MTDPTRHPRWQRRPEQRRSEILEAAIQAFSQHGFRGATLSHVGQGAGVSSGTVSHYFGCKADLFEAVIVERFVHFVEHEEALLTLHQGSARVLLDQHLHRLWAHTWTPCTLELMQVVQAELAEFPDSGRLLFRQVSERWRRLFGAILQAGVAAGEFRPLDVDLAARSILYALVGAAQRVAAFTPFDPTMPDRDAMGRTLFEMIQRFVQLEESRPPRGELGTDQRGDAL